MTSRLLAEFRTVDDLAIAMKRVCEAGGRVLDAYSPYPVEDLAQRHFPIRSKIRQKMLVIALVTAGLAYGLQVYSAVYDYPYNSGGRPLHSWPVFLLVPFEISVLAAAIAGMICFFRACDLPRLHNPLFEVPGFERATQDRFFLLAEPEDPGLEEPRLRHLLEGAAAVVVTRLPDI